LREFEKIQHLGYSLNNISPDTILLNKDKNEFFFSQFHNVTRFVPTGSNSHEYDIPSRQRTVATGKEKFLEKQTGEKYIFMSRG